MEQKGFKTMEQDKFKRKPGTKPVSKKSKWGPSFDDVDLNKNTFYVHPKVRHALEEEGFKIRWVNTIQMKEKGGYHRWGWKIFKTSDFERGSDRHDILGVKDAEYGIGSDGCIRRRELALAIRPETTAKKHRAIINDKTARQKNDNSKAAADQIKHIAKSSRTKVTIIEDE